MLLVSTWKYSLGKDERAMKYGISRYTPNSRVARNGKSVSWHKVCAAYYGSKQGKNGQNGENKVINRAV